MSMPSLDDDHSSLLMPNPHNAPERCCDSGLKGRDYDYEMGLCTHF